MKFTSKRLWIYITLFNIKFMHALIACPNPNFEKYIPGQHYTLLKPQFPENVNYFVIHHISKTIVLIIAILSNISRNYSSAELTQPTSSFDFL